MLKNRMSCGRLLLSASFIIGGLYGLWLVRNAAASPEHFPPSAPHGSEWFQASRSCLQPDSDAILSYAEGTWSVELALTIPDVSLVPDDKFAPIWHDEAGNQSPLIKDSKKDKDVLIQRLPPIKANIVFDIDQEALYAGPFLTTDDLVTLEENRRQEVDFWHRLCDDLLRQFSFEGGRFTDMGMVYGGKEGKPIFTTDDYTLYSNGVFNSLQDAIRQSYLGGSRVGDLSAIMKNDEWPKREGEKIMVIVRWRTEPLSLSSYPSLREAQFRDRTFLLVIGRTLDFPEEWESLESRFKRFGIQLAYVPAPPAYSQNSEVVTNRLHNTFDKLQDNIRKNRERVKIRFEFPYLLDRYMVEKGRLQIIHSTCLSEKIALSPMFQQQSPPRLPMAITLGAAAAALLFVIQVTFFAAIIGYKSSMRIREAVNRVVAK